MIALIFLGLGWNFLFISGTSLLVLCYREEEKFRAQGYNDLIVYTIQAAASLSAGIFLSLTSWKTMNLICLIFLIIIALSTIRADLKKNPSNWITGVFWNNIKNYLCFLVLNFPPLTSCSKKEPSASPTLVKVTPVAPS